MCPDCGKKISPLWSMSVNELMNYARANRYNPAATHGRLDTVMEILQKNSGCAPCIKEVADLKRSIF